LRRKDELSVLAQENKIIESVFNVNSEQDFSRMERRHLDGTAFEKRSRRLFSDKFVENRRLMTPLSRRVPSR
jgi:hypothetical protein